MYISYIYDSFHITEMSFIVASNSNSLALEGASIGIQV